MTVTALDNFRVNFRDIIDAEGLTQREVADKCGIAFTYVNRILNGHCEPSLTVCEKIANGLRVPLETLIGEPGKVLRHSA